MRSFWHDDEATATVEYALLLSLVVLVTVVAWTALGGAVTTAINASVNTISAGPN
ncbi:MAG: Flp family type IVb pilin [candidate division WS1 bacterium]|nr:Flp family type IVb pilin [candidate division WS1 bacterium]